MVSQTKVKKKLTILLLNEHFFDTWLGLDFIVPFSQRFELSVSIPDQAKLEMNFENNGITVNFFTRSWSTRTQRILFNLNWVGNRAKSPSFKFWLQRHILGNEYWSLRNPQYLFSQMKIIARMAVKDPTIFVAFIKPIRVMLLHIMKKIEKMNDETLNYIPIGTEIVIIPSQGGAEWDIPGIIKNCRRDGVLSVLSIDNWDNLTSKQVLRFKPDFVTVMGKSAVNQAIAIHGLSEEKVLPVGLPRFDVYRKNQERMYFTRLSDDCFRISYLGFSIPYDEIAVLNKLVRDLGRFENPRIEISYRPHPARKPRRVEAIPDTRLIIQKSNTIQAPEFGIPNPRKYIDDLMHFDLVIATPTTMAIETMALGIPCIIDATHDGLHRTSAGNAFDNYMHLQDLKTIPELQIAKTYDELLKIVAQFYIDRPITVNYQIDQLVNLDAQNYVEQLINYLPR